MEEYLRMHLQHTLGNRGTVEVVTYYDKEREQYRRDCWILKFTISHKDITYIEEYYLNDILFRSDVIRLGEVVERYTQYVQNELLKRFYEKEES